MTPESTSRGGGTVFHGYAPAACRVITGDEFAAGNSKEDGFMVTKAASLSVCRVWTNSLSMSDAYSPLVPDSTIG